MAPGVSEEIYVSFTPTEYRYYQDTIKIHCEGESLKIPVHAYPVINKKVPIVDQVPRIVCFGKSCQIGQTY